MNSASTAFRPEPGSRFEERLAGDRSGIVWSAHAIDVADGSVVFSFNADAILDTASVGKIFLLLAAASEAERGHLDLAETIELNPSDAFGDSGLWNAMRSRALPLYDLCVLIGAVSDNQATNSVLRRIGLPAVREVEAALGLRNTRLNDAVRWPLLDGDPKTLSSGTARELAAVMAAIGARRALSADSSRQVEDWLATGTDCSMVASAFGLDPLAHRILDRGIRLSHKTGTTSVVRCDTGLVRSRTRSIAYAVLANWQRAGADLRDTALAAMREAGETIAGCIPEFARDAVPGSPRRPTALIVVNDGDSGPRGLPRVLADAGVDAVVHDATLAPLPRSLAGYDALIMLGGGLMPDQDDEAPWLPDERALAREAIDADIPTLGICLGGQLLAHVAGGRVRASGPLPERGLTRIDFADSASSDPVFGESGPSGLFMENHKDYIEALPEQAVLIGSTERCPIQAFRIGERVWGVQFHPEVPPERAATFNPARLVADGFDPQQIAAFATTHAEEARSDAAAVLSRFAAVIADAGTP